MKSLLKSCGVANADVWDTNGIDLRNIATVGLNNAGRLGREPACAAGAGSQRAGAGPGYC